MCYHVKSYDIILYHRIYLSKSTVNKKIPKTFSKILPQLFIVQVFNLNRPVELKSKPICFINFYFLQRFYSKKAKFQFETHALRSIFSLDA